MKKILSDFQLLKQRFLQCLRIVIKNSVRKGLSDGTAQFLFVIVAQTRFFIENTETEVLVDISIHQTLPGFP